MNIATIVLLLLAAAGFKGNYDFIERGGLEHTDPKNRTTFTIGMNVIPVALLIAGASCGIAAYNKREQERHN